MQKTRATAIAMILLCSLALSSGVLAARLTGYDLPWRVMGSGGGKAESTNYALGAALGQTATGLASSTNYQVRAGFWHGVALPTTPPLLLPLVLSSWGG